MNLDAAVNMQQVMAAVLAAIVYACQPTLHCDSFVSTVDPLCPEKLLHCSGSIAGSNLIKATYAHQG